MLFFICLLVNVVLSFLIASAAKDKGKSFGGYFLLSFLLSPIVGVIVYLVSGNTVEIETPEPSYYFNNSNNAEPPSETKKCPYCAEDIKKEAIVCRYCGKDLQSYEKEQAQKAEEKKSHMREKLEVIFNDSGFMEEAARKRRLYGKGFYIGHLKAKAQELGLGDIDISEDDIE